jgi:cytochrome c
MQSVVRRPLGIAALAAILLTPSALAQTAGDPAAGEDVFKKCRACHEVGPSARNKVGPVLNGIVGRKAGTIDGFAYSDANKAAGANGLLWSEAELDRYLTNPRAHMPGNKMAFAGLPDAQDRADIIAYLKTFK